MTVQAAARRRGVQEVGFAAGFALLLALLVAGIWAAMEDAAGPRPGLTLHDGPLAQVDGQVIVHPASAAGRSEVTFSVVLPPALPEASPWVVWLPREPVQAVWLQAANGWRSHTDGFYAPMPSLGTLPAGYYLPLPTHWEGPVDLTLHAQGRIRTHLHPQVVPAEQARRLELRSTAAAAGVYASLFTLSLLALALHAAARDRAFVWLFACTTASLLALVALNGHLYGAPGLRLAGGWGAQGIWALLFVAQAAWLGLLRRYLEGPTLPVRVDRLLGVGMTVLLLAAGVCLLGIARLEPVMQMTWQLAWKGVGVVSVALLVLAGRHRLPMAWAVLALVVATLVLAAMRRPGGRDPLPELLTAHYTWQLMVVAVLAIMAVGLIKRISEYRDQRDRDRRARLDTELRMHREAARSDLAQTLQAQLRQVDQADAVTTGFQVALQALDGLLPLRWCALVAYGYHGGEALQVYPAAMARSAGKEIHARLLPLRRLAGPDGQPVQQPARDGAMEAVVPLQVRAPGWGGALLRRVDGQPFDADELALVTEMLRITQLHLDQHVATLQLRRTAELDALTGSLNRRSIDQWLVRCFAEAERDGLPVSVLFVDLDRFKSINDRLGHAGGDHCLRAVAVALRGALADGGLFGRYGGEEFIAVLPGHDGAAARRAGEAMRAAVERLAVRWNEQTVRLTVSVGVATRRAGEAAPERALERADRALYAAKRGGRNCVQVAPAVFS